MKKKVWRQNTHKAKQILHFLSCLIFKNFLLLQANIIKRILSLCWTVDVKFFNKTFFTLFRANFWFFFQHFQHCMFPARNPDLPFWPIKVFILPLFFHCSLNYHQTNRFGVSDPLDHLISKKNIWQDFCGHLDQNLLRKTDFSHPSCMF